MAHSTTETLISSSKLSKMKTLKHSSMTYISGSVPSLLRMNMALLPIKLLNWMICSVMHPCNTVKCNIMNQRHSSNASPGVSNTSRVVSPVDSAR